jgi:hypothetical protein
MINLIIIFISFILALSNNIRLRNPSKNKKYKKRQFKDITNDFANWFKRSGLKNEDGTYVYRDHSGIILIIGKRRSGKGVTSYNIVELLQKHDPSRILCVWKAPPKVVPYLNSVGIKAKNVESHKDLPKNCIWFIDEGILNVNAKKALTKFARQMDEIISVISHKRIIMIITFQRWQIFASLIEQSDCIIYKKLGERMMNRARNDPFLKENKELINKLPKEKAFVECDLDGYEATGFVSIGLPSWYSPILSESYEDINLDFELNEDKKRNVLLEEIAIELLKNGRVYDPKDKIGKETLISVIKKTYENDKLKSSEITTILQNMARVNREERWKIHGKKDHDKKDENNSEGGIVLDETAKLQNITDLDLEITNLFANDKKSTEFKDYKGGFSAKTVMQMVRKTINFLMYSYESKSKADKGGNKYERLIANHYILNKGEYFIRALASGGKRGKFTIEPDGIHFTKNGEIRIVQIKVRGTNNFTFQPKEFETELQIVRILKAIPFFANITSAWLYYMKKGDNFDKIMEIEINEDNFEKYLEIDFERQFHNFRDPDIKRKKIDQKNVKIPRKVDISLDPKDENISNKENSKIKKINPDNNKIKVKTKDKMKIKK